MHALTFICGYIPVHSQCHCFCPLSMLCIIFAVSLSNSSAIILVTSHSSLHLSFRIFVFLLFRVPLLLSSCFCFLFDHIAYFDSFHFLVLLVLPHCTSPLCSSFCEFSHCFLFLVSLCVFSVNHNYYRCFCRTVELAFGFRSLFVHR